MSRHLYETVSRAGHDLVRVRARGLEVLATPMINRGVAFTHEQREALGLRGLLPDGVLPIQVQARRAYQQVQEQASPIAKHTFLTNMRERNEVLFYRLLADHLEEFLPIIYTPTIGTVIERFSSLYHRPRGVFLSIDYPDDMQAGLLDFGVAPEDVDLVVVTDSEGILGIGDQGVGGIQIALGKLAVYTAAAGINPGRTVPVVLDVGTDNLKLLNDEYYVGRRHSRVRGERYDDFIERFVATVRETFPNAMLHWEDFGASNAHRILERYRGEICSFNDDIQGTAAIVAAAVIAAVRDKGERLSDQRFVVHGSGTAGIGIADLLCDLMVAEGLSRDDARRRFWCLGSKGLITAALGERARPFQRPYARPDADVEGWAATDLAATVDHVHPTVLIGTSAQPGAFSETIVRSMAQHCPRPIILPLSNPTVLAEATPAELLEWTDDRALIATGSPFPAITKHGITHEIAQANNALVFPGLGLGVIVARASRISDAMIAAAARAVGELVDLRRPGAALLPSMTDLRLVSATVAVAVVRAAQAEGLAGVEVPDVIQAVTEAMWQPVYPDIEAI